MTTQINFCVITTLIIDPDPDPENGMVVGKYLGTEGFAGIKRSKPINKKSVLTLMAGSAHNPVAH